MPLDATNCKILCAKDFKDYLVWELTLTEEEHKTKLATSLEYLWQISEFSSQGNLELQYLYSKLELLKVLMGCNFQQHDLTQGISRALDQSETKRQGNITGGSQASNHQHAESSSCSVSEYNDAATSFMEAYAKRLGRSDTTEVAKSFSEDKGFGASRTDACSDEESNSSSEAHNGSGSAGKSRGNGIRKGREYEFNQSSSKGNGSTPLIGEWSLTVTGSTWDRDMFNTAQSNNAEKRVGQSYRNAQSANNASRDAKRDSCSFFQNASTSCSQGTSDMVACDTSRNTRDAVALASGYGESKSRYDSRSVTGSQGQSDSHSNDEFHSVGNGYKTNKLDVIKNSQKYKHLIDSYDLTRKYLEMIKKLTVRGEEAVVEQAVLPREWYNCFYSFMNTRYCNRCRVSYSACGCRRVGGYLSYA